MLIGLARLLCQLTLNQSYWSANSTLKSYWFKHRLLKQRPWVTDFKFDISLNFEVMSVYLLWFVLVNNKIAFTLISISGSIKWWVQKAVNYWHKLSYQRRNGFERVYWSNVSGPYSMTATISLCVVILFWSRICPTQSQNLRLISKTHSSPLERYTTYSDSAIMHFDIPENTVFASFGFVGSEEDLSIFGKFSFWCGELNLVTL